MNAIKMHTPDDVLKMFPDAVRPSRKSLEDAAKAFGCYRDVLGKIAFTDEDVAALLEHLRAAPTGADAIAKLGPGRLFAYVPPKNSAGYMVFIGDQLVTDSAVFVGFAPANGAGDLLRLVQFGSPDPLAILHFFPATPADVDDHKAALKQWRCRDDNTNWYMRSRAVNSYILDLRSKLNPTQEND